MNKTEIASLLKVLIHKGTALDHGSQPIVQEWFVERLRTFLDETGLDEFDLESFIRFARPALHDFVGYYMTVMGLMPGAPETLVSLRFNDINELSLLLLFNPDGSLQATKYHGFYA